LDLAMMRLFGGFGPECFATYMQLAPLEPGHSRRLEFYQLYFLLVHVNLHGPSWAGQVAQLAWGLS
jgi:fructosamine-3-kinase